MEKSKFANYVPLQKKYVPLQKKIEGAANEREDQ